MVFQCVRKPINVLNQIEREWCVGLFFFVVWWSAERAKMFTGWTNQMSSWIGAKKGQSPSSQEPTGSPSGAEEQPEPAAPAPAGKLRIH